MIAPKRIHLLLLREIISLSIVLVAALTSVLFLFQILRFSEYIFGSRETLVSLLFFIVFLFPGLFKMTIPLSLLLATAIVVGRMSQDRELEAWMAAGGSVFDVCKAPFVLGTISCVLSLIAGLYLEPLSRHEWNQFKWLYARRGVEQMIESRLYPQTFFVGPLSGGDTEICLYVDSLTPDRKSFNDAFLSIKRGSEKFASVLVSEEGAFRRENNDGLSDYVLDLRNGTIYEPIETKEPLSILAEEHPDQFNIPKQPQSEELKEFLANEPGVSWRVVRFSRFRLSLVSLFRTRFETQDPNSSDIRTKYPHEYVTELRKIRAQKDWKQHPGQIRDFTFFYEQIVVSLVCMLLPVIGVCLGFQDPRRRAGSLYIGVGLVIVIFYSTVMLGQQLPMNWHVEPEIMLVLPVAATGAVAALLLRMRALYPPSVGIWEFFSIEIQRLWRKAVRRRGGSHS